MANPGGELVRVQQLQEIQSENEHLKSKAVDFTMIQTLQVQVTKLKSENEGLKLSVEELMKAHELVEITLRQRDELIDEMKSQVSELLKKLQISNKEMKQQIIIFEEYKQMFLAKNECLENLSSSVQKEYNDLLASNDVLKQILETKFKFPKHDTSLEKMIETIEKEYESNVSKISITSSTFEFKNLELVKEIRDKVKCFDEEKKVFETKILKLGKVLAQRFKDFDDVKKEVLKRTDKFEIYFANLEKQNALLKSQLASQNYTSLQKENNDSRMSYNDLKDKIEKKEHQVSKRIEKNKTYCEELEKENDDLKIHYKR
ncbi:hypothetical protein Tco_0905221 [Tanacetum coccineum]